MKKLEKNDFFNLIDSAKHIHKSDYTVENYTKENLITFVDLANQKINGAIIITIEPGIISHITHKHYCNPQFPGFWSLSYSTKDKTSILAPFDKPVKSKAEYFEKVTHIVQSLGLNPAQVHPNSYDASYCLTTEPLKIAGYLFNYCVTEPAPLPEETEENEGFNIDDFAIVEDLSFLSSEDEKKEEMKEEKEKKWEDKLETDSRGNLLKTKWNLWLILENDEELVRMSPRLNAFDMSLMRPEGLPWVSDGDIYTNWTRTDTLELKYKIQDKYLLFFATSTLDDVLTFVTNSRPYNPIVDYLDGLPAWDGKERIKDLLFNYMGVNEKHEWAGDVLELHLIAAVKRAYAKPGCPIKYDMCPVLVGTKGIGKTDFWNKLFTIKGTTHMGQVSANLNTRRSQDVIARSWCINFDEMSILKSNSVKEVKSFISRTEDDLRKPRKQTECRVRSFVTCGTTNDFKILPESERRFVMIECDKDKIKRQMKEGHTFKEMEGLLHQIWAEAKTKAQKMKETTLELDEKVKDEIAKAQNEYIESSPLQDAIQEWLDSLNDEQKKRVCNRQIEEYVLHRPLESKTEKREVELALKNLGYKKVSGQKRINGEVRRNCYDFIG